MNAIIIDSFEVAQPPLESEVGLEWREGGWGDFPFRGKGDFLGMNFGHEDLVVMGEGAEEGIIGWLFGVGLELL